MMIHSPRKYILLILGLILLAAGTAFYTFNSQEKTAPVVYVCEGGKQIAATYHEGPPAPQPEPGEPSTPTGSVEVSLDGASPVLLQQTISASGVRYANADESFVFWNKGTGIFIMRDGAIDPSYSDCVESKE